MEANSARPPSRPRLDNKASLPREELREGSVSNVLFKSGFVSIIGAPNVGKSTLLNYLVGQKIAIVSPKPQTTRNRILGVRSGVDYQIIFIDTPGIHQARGDLNLSLVRTALATLATVDLILFLVEAQEPENVNNAYILETLRQVGTNVLLVINKIDRVQPEALSQVMVSYEGRYPFKASLPISALSGSGTDDLLTRIIDLLPVGPAYYPRETVTDLSERFLCGEIVREKILHLTTEEVPYAVAVTVASFKEDPGRNLIHIHADIHVERQSQKAILIGKRGAMLRQIGQQARLDMENLLGARVFLELWVRVQKKWRKDPHALREFGYQ
jgi:GTP-binding protein Era